MNSGGSGGDRHVRRSGPTTLTALALGLAGMLLATTVPAQQSDADLFDEILRGMDDIEAGRRDEAAERWRRQGAAVREKALRDKSEGGNEVDVLSLLAVGTNPNAAEFGFGTTPLHGAACRCHPDVVNVLLSAGADPNIPDRYGNVPLHYASGDEPGEGFTNCARGKASFDEFDGHCTAVIDALLRRGADPNHANQVGESPLHFAARESGRRAVERVRRLLDGGADTNRRSATAGNTPLHAALGSGHDVDIVSALLAAGARLDGRNNSGDTPLLHWIRHGGNQDRITRMLLDAGADPDGKARNGDAALHLAVKEGGSWSDGQSGTVDALLNAGADPCVRDAEGYTPYHLSRGHSRSLLDRAFGFDRASPTSRGCPSSAELIAEDEAEERPGVFAARKESQRGAERRKSAERQAEYSRQMAKKRLEAQREAGA